MINGMIESKDATTLCNIYKKIIGESNECITHDESTLLYLMANYIMDKTAVKHTEVEILDALHVLSDVCRTSDGCENCPLRVNGSNCGLSDSSPLDWGLAEAREWRAFKCD